MGLAGRTMGAAALALSLVAAVSGCDVLAPTRDPTGAIVTATRMPSTDAWVGDCFSFVDGSTLAYAKVVPCSEVHTHVVLARGTVLASAIAVAGGMQAAVSHRCDPIFAAFVAASGEDTKPEQQSIVATVGESGGAVTKYSCLATDVARPSAA